MKITAVATLLALTLPSLTSAAAWTFVDGYGHTFSGDKNRGCTAQDTNKGQEFSWNRGWFKDCCIHLYERRGCESEVGLSCPDWKKKSSKKLQSFKVTDC